MIPEFLKKYESSLKACQRKAISIKVNPIETPVFDDHLDIKTSKLLGLPFFPKSKSYPKDKNEKPMIMVAQLNFSEMPSLSGFPEGGILQLFLSATDWYDEDSAVVYHKLTELEEDYITDFSFLSDKDYEEIPMLKVHELSFEEMTENGGLDDCQFDFLFDGLDWLEFEESLTETEAAAFNEFFDVYGHKTGGYAAFAQGDPRDYNDKKRDDIQLLQIDSDECILFGDSGLGHVFIDQESLKKRDFEKAYFHWDCY